MTFKSVFGHSKKKVGLLCYSEGCAAIASYLRVRVRPGYAPLQTLGTPPEKGMDTHRFSAPFWGAQ